MAESRTIPSADFTTELRLALVLNGGVSLAIWIGGLCSELLRLVRAGDANAGDENPYTSICSKRHLRPVVDVITGASAGGLNGVFFAVSRLFGHDDLQDLRQLWVDQGGIAQMLRDPFDPEVPSLLKGDEYFLEALTGALRRLTSSKPKHPDDRIDLRLTATSLTGEERRIIDAHDGLLTERHHAVEFHFKNNPDLSDFWDDPADGASTSVVARLARAARTTASFPFAFEPSFCAVGERDDEFPSRQLDLSVSRYLVDGGALVNLPVGAAVDAIFSMPANTAVERVMIAVVPDPTVPPQDDRGDDKKKPPSVASVVAQTAVGAPRVQGVAAFLDELARRNRDVHVRREERLELLTTVGPTTMQELATHLLPTYREGRRHASITKIRNAWVAVTHSPASFDDVEVLVGLNPPWLPNVATTGRLPARGWEASTVKRSAAVTLFLLNEAARGLRAANLFGPASRVLAMKAKVHEVRELAEKVHPTSLEQVLRGLLRSSPDLELGGFVENLKARSVERADEFEREVHRLGVDLAAFLGLLDSDGTVWTTAGLPEHLRALANHVDACGQFLLSVEVVETIFSGYAVNTEQRVDFVRADPLSPAAVDPRRRQTAKAKIAGVQLGHFGAFLKRAWRANDWMWGRLDGATLTARLIVPDLEAAVEVNTALDQPVSASPQDVRFIEDVRNRVAERAQLDILRDELGYVAAQVAADEAEGALQGSLAQDFRRQLRAVGGSDASGGRLPAEGPRAVSDEQLRRLLAQNHIGEERIANESGSDLLTLTAAGALATGATVVQGGSPPVLKSLVRTVRYVGLVLWGLLKTAVGRGQAGAVLAAMLFALGLAGVVVDLFTGVNLGFLGAVAWLMFGAGVLIALTRAPLVALPIFLIGFIPGLLSALPDEPWTWWPDGWLWPKLPAWIGVVFFVAAGVAVAFIRRPSGSWRRRRTERNAGSTIGDSPSSVST